MYEQDCLLCRWALARECLEARALTSALRSATQPFVIHQGGCFLQLLLALSPGAHVSAVPCVAAVTCALA
jgi:hypothetical protein